MKYIWQYFFNYMLYLTVIDQDYTNFSHDRVTLMGPLIEFMMYLTALNYI